MSSIPLREKSSIPEDEQDANKAKLEKVLNDLAEHLETLHDDPTAQQDETLIAFTKTALMTPALKAILTSDQALRLVRQLYTLLAQLQDPSDELFSLLDALLQDVSLGQIMSISPSVDLAAGLAIDADKYNTLVLNLLENADGTSARRLATNFGNVFEALVRLFLSSHDIGISGRACAILLKFLREGNGEVAKRFFRDDGIYGAIFEICDDRRKSGKMSRTQRSIAQTRLLDFVASLAAWNWDTAVKSHNPEVESRYGLKSGEGLLDFATRYQADFEDDVLLHRSLIDVLKTLLEQETTKSWTGDRSPALEFLISRKLHQQAIKYFLTPRDPSIESVDLSLLSPGSAQYSAAFLDSHPNFFEETPPIIDLFVKRLEHLNVQTVTPETLHVLASIPRVVIRSHSRLITQLPIGSGNSNVIMALAYILAGPKNVEERIPRIQNSQLLDIQEERSAARGLFQEYSNTYPRLFHDLVAIANKTALPVAALAALEFISSIANAQWDLPNGGLKAIFDDVRNRDAVMTYIRGFPNRPQGTALSREDDQYKIAERRFGLVKLFLRKLESIEAREAQHEVWIARLKDRVRLGIWGPSGTQVASEGM